MGKIVRVQEGLEKTVREQAGLKRQFGFTVGVEKEVRVQEGLARQFVSRRVQQKQFSSHVFTSSTPGQFVFETPWLYSEVEEENRDFSTCTLLLFPWCHKPRKR